MSGYFIFMPQDKTVASIADAPGSSPSKTQRDCAHDERCIVGQSLREKTADNSTMILYSLLI